MSKDQFVSRACRDLGINRKNSSYEYRCYQQDKKTKHLKYKKRQGCR